MSSRMVYLASFSIAEGAVLLFLMSSLLLLDHLAVPAATVIDLVCGFGLIYSLRVLLLQRFSNRATLLSRLRSLPLELLEGSWWLVQQFVCFVVDAAYSGPRVFATLFWRITRQSCQQLYRDFRIPSILGCSTVPLCSIVGFEAAGLQGLIWTSLLIPLLLFIVFCVMQQTVIGTYHWAQKRRVWLLIVALLVMLLLASLFRRATQPGEHIQA